MNVHYKCRCMDEEAVIAVPDRTAGQDIVDWVGNTVGYAIGADHKARSPRCPSRVMEYAKFEVDPAGGPLGTITKQ